MVKLIYWLPVFIWLGIIFILSSIPASSLPQMPTESWNFWAHRSAHAGEYSVLGVLTIRAYSIQGSKMEVKAILYLSLFILLSGLLDEWHQSFVPGRHAQLIDALFDTICGASGMLIYAQWQKRCKSLDA